MKYIEYKPEGSTNPLNIVFSILICSFITFFLGWIYTLNIFIPLIYFNILVPFAFAIAFAYSVQITSKFLQIKDRKSRLFIGLIVVLVAYYSQWVSFIIEVYNEGFPSINDYFNYWMYPEGIIENILEINQLGSWGFGRSEVAMVNGTVLSIIWIFEAVILFFIPLAMVYRFTENPFSEKLNKWYPKFVLREEFENIYSKKSFVRNIEEKGISYILNLKKDIPNRYSKISLFYLEGEDKQYVSIESVRIDIIKDSKKKIEEIIKPFEISTIDAKKLINKFGTEKESYLDY